MKPILPIMMFAAVVFVSACQTSVKETEPSQAFREALSEVMAAGGTRTEASEIKKPTRRDPVVLKLSLGDCVEIALQHNRAVLFEQLNAEVAEADVLASKANLDFTLGARVGYNRATQEIQSRFPGDNRDEEVNAVTDIGVNAIFPFATGTTVELDTGFRRSDSNSPFQTFEYFPSSTVTVRQNLLNGLGFVPNLGGTWIAEGQKRVADWQVDVVENDQAFEVAMAYWNLVEAEQELGVLLRQADLANDALDLAISRFEAELGTELDVLAQRANLKSQEVDIIRAEALIEDRTDELLVKMHPDILHGYATILDFRVIIAPTTLLNDATAVEPAPDTMQEVKAALRRRPEILQAVQRVKNAGIAIEMGQYALLPSLTLEAELGVDGYGTELDDSLTSYGNFDNLRYGFSLDLSVPLQNSRARADMQKSQIQKRQAILAARDAETAIIVEVAHASRAVRTNQRALEAAAEASELQRQTYASEGERQSAGLATAFEVKQSLNDLAAAELAEVKARINLERARLQLRHATNDLG